MGKLKYIRYMADFETTVYEGQKETEVWAAAIVALNSPDEYSSVHIDNCLDDFMSRVEKLQGNDIIIYFHNLKFDGTFILDWLFRSEKYKEYCYIENNEKKLYDSLDFFKNAPAHSFTYMVSDKGQWYDICIKTGKKRIRFYDSYKLINTSVKAMGKAFQTKHQKTSIEYKGVRVSRGTITEQEKEYIANDVLVVKEALNIMLSEGHDKMTIASCAIHEYKKGTMLDARQYLKIFPRLTGFDCPVDDFIPDADAYIRQSYKGGYCYVNQDKFKGSADYVRIHESGCTADVNSLYPSIMHSISGNVYPYGAPQWFKGAIPEICKKKDENGKPVRYYFVRIRCDFDLKPGYLPTIQIKGSLFYYGNEWLKSSTPRIFEKHPEVKDVFERPVLTLTMTDFELLLTHYDVKNLEIIDGCYFKCKSGFFDNYINYWSEIKQKSTGAMRQIAKMFLNSIYGKFSTSADSSYKVFYIDSEKDCLVSSIVKESNKKVEYIAIGSAITSYARYFTITHAQENYNHFCYADTDSIHCDTTKENLVDISIHPTKFLNWKIENEWKEAIFVRQKTYIEVNTDDTYLIKCAGMGKEAKAIIEKDLKAGNMALSDFRKGLEVPGNLKAKIIKGGTVLQDVNYKLR